MVFVLRQFIWASFAKLTLSTFVYAPIRSITNGQNPLQFTFLSQKPYMLGRAYAASSRFNIEPRQSIFHPGDTACTLHLHAHYTYMHTSPTCTLHLRAHFTYVHTSPTRTLHLHAHLTYVRNSPTCTLHLRAHFTYVHTTPTCTLHLRAHVITAEHLPTASGAHVHLSCFESHLYAEASPRRWTRGAWKFPSKMYIENEKWFLTEIKSVSSISSSLSGKEHKQGISTLPKN